MIFQTGYAHFVFEQEKRGKHAFGNLQIIYN